MQILIPLAGVSPFFKPDDYPFPKPLIEVAGKPMIERVVENLSQVAKGVSFVFVVKQNDAAKFSLDRTLRLIADDCQIIALRQDTKGALCSALMAIDHLDEEQPLIVCNGDQVIDADLRRIVDQFATRKVDAGVITFESVHPRWSYVRMQGDRVIQAAEKEVISRNAIAGFYYFRTAGMFTDAAMRSIAGEAAVNGQYFIAPALNELILQGRTVVGQALGASEAYHSFYSPAKIEEFEENRLVQTISRASPSHPSVRVVIPAAGEGSRFRTAGFAKPKPFIDVRGKPMIEHVLENVLPAQASAHILLRSDHVEAEPKTANRLSSRRSKIHEVAALTEGTACTILLARREFDDANPLLVANSDQLVDFSVNDFVADCIARGLDGSILVFRDPTKNPKWSFARIGDDGLVEEVREKVPISDMATVGIYLFRRGSDFVKAATDMIARNDRVNGEFYTCPVYNYMIANGLRIGVYEVPQESMHGLGTPEDLAAFLAQDQTPP